MGIVGIVVGIVVGGLFGGWIGWLLHDQKVNKENAKTNDEIAELKAKNAKLEGQLEQVDNAQKLVKTAKAELRDAFDATAKKALQDNRHDFLGLANENLGKQLASAKGEFEKRHGEFQALVTPLSEDYRKLGPQIESLTTQTRKLYGALTDNQATGIWGEVHLKRVVEIAGMREHVDFNVQVTVGGSGSRLDMVIKLPYNRKVVVDAKASRADYLASQEATDEASAEKALAKHAAALKRQITGLASKNYGSKVDEALDYVVMFVPGDQFLAAALKADPELIEYAMTRRVAVVTPASLIALLWTIHNGWQHARIAENAKELQEAGTELHKRICKFAEHNENVGKGLSKALEAYNQSVASFRSRVVPQGRRFAKLTLDDADNFPQPTQVAESVRISDSARTHPSGEAQAIGQKRPSSREATSPHQPSLLPPE